MKNITILFDYKYAWMFILASAAALKLLFRHDSIWGIVLLVLIGIVIYQFKNRNIAKITYNGVWLKAHGDIINVKFMKREGSNLVITDKDDKDYIQNCSYCLTLHIDAFVKNWHLTSR
jgi:hypothetical protein